MLITCDKCGESFDNKNYEICPFCNEIKENSDER